jgi:hypothetical protein
MDGTEKGNMQQKIQMMSAIELKWIGSRQIEGSAINRASFSTPAEDLFEKFVDDIAGVGVF